MLFYIDIWIFLVAKTTKKKNHLFIHLDEIVY